MKKGKSKVTVYTARAVLTMNPGRPGVQAAAVLDGKVLSTGTVESMKPRLARRSPGRPVNTESMQNESVENLALIMENRQVYKNTVK